MIVARAAQVKAVPRIGVPFAPLPLDVKARRDISPAAKLVFATVANQARMRCGDVSNLTNRRISERAGLSVAAVRRALDELEAVALVRRLYGASARVRLGIAVTYAPTEVAQPGATTKSEVARPGQAGCSPVSSGGCSPGATHLVRTCEEHPETVSPPDSDPESVVPDGATAAAYLKAMIVKGREQAGPVHVRNLPVEHLDGDRAPSTVIDGSPTRFHRDEASREIGRMVGALAANFTTGYLGRRRLSPRRLQEQLAEVRRRYGRRDGTPMS